MDARILRQRSSNLDTQDEPPHKRQRAAFGNLTNKNETVALEVKKKGVTKVIGPSRSAFNQTKKQPTVGKLKVAAKKEASKKTNSSSAVTQPSNSETSVKTDVRPDVETQIKPEDKAEDDEIIELCTRFDWIDVDKDNKCSPYHVTEFVNDIFEHYKKREVLMAPENGGLESSLGGILEQFTVTDYMCRQLQVTASMRGILVDWLVEVQQNFELHHETLYLAVKLIDRFLDRKPIEKKNLQLLGATAVLVASKYEEILPPLVDDFMYVCDDTYTRDEFLAMEHSLLKTLQFDLGIPLSYSFLRRYAQCARVSLQTLTLSRYILESSLLEYMFVSQCESLMAAACLLLAMCMNGDGVWDFTMVHYTGYQVCDLAFLSRKLNAMIQQLAGSTLKIIFTKYSHSVFHGVAKTAPLNYVQLQQHLPLRN